MLEEIIGRCKERVACAGRQEAQEIPKLEEVESVEKLERFEGCPKRNRVATIEVGEVVGQLQNVLIQDVVNGKRLMTEGRVGHTILCNLNSRERSAERIAVIAEAIVTCEEPIGEFLISTVHFEGKRVQLVVDPIASIPEREAILVGPAPGSCIAENEGMRREISPGVEQVVSKR